MALSYSGNMKYEVNTFKSFDDSMIKFMQSIADSIGELNSKWNDKYSTEYLGKFNTNLKTSVDEFKKVHSQLRTYFSSIQELLMEFSKGGTNFELPEFKEINYSEPTEIETSGFVFSISDVKSIVSSIQQNARAAIDSVNDFSPQLVSLSGDDDMGVLTAVQSNFTTAGRSYGVLVAPLNSIIKTCDEVVNAYTQMEQNIANSGGTR